MRHTTKKPLRLTILSTLAVIFGVFFSSASAQPIADAEGLGLSSDEPVQIDGDRLEMFEARGLAVFDGNVSVVQGDTVLKTAKLEIHYNTSGDGSIASGQAAIDRLEASGGVRIQTATQVATGDRGTYNMQSRVLVLTGKRVTLSEGGNVATGCKLTVTMSNSQAKLDGCGSAATRPTILIQPKSLNAN